MKYIFYRFLLLIAFFTFAGCQNSSWKNINDAVSVFSWKYTVEKGSGKIEIYRLDPNKFTVSLVHDTQSPKTVSQWAETQQEDYFFINGGYFHKDYTSSGYVQVDGERVGKRIFDKDKSGFILVNDDKLSLHDFANTPIAKIEASEYALQSYPFFFKNSQKSIAKDSGKTARRTAIGTDANSNLYIIIVDTRHLSLFQLMEELSKTQIPFTDILNLDGGPSTGFQMNIGKEKKIINSFWAIPNGILFKQINNSN